MSNKKSNEEFIIELKNKNNKVISLEPYVDARTKIKFQCKTCGYIFKTTPDSVLRGSSCAKCKGILKKTNQDFLVQMKNVNNNIEFLEEYINNRTKILCKCKRCDFEFKKTPSDLLSGSGCPNCYHNSTSFLEQCLYFLMCDIYGKDNVLNRDTTTINEELDVYVKKNKIAIEYGSWFWHKNKIDTDYSKINLCTNKGIDIVIIYDAYDDKPILDNHFITISEDISKKYDKIIILLNNVLKYFGIDYNVDYDNFQTIKKRAYENSSKKNTDEFKEEVKKIHPHINVLGKYKTAKIPIECKCEICKCQWTPTPDNLLRGQGCPDCSKQKISEKLTKTYDEGVRTKSWTL